MTPEQLAALAGTLLSLAFSYIPGLAPWFDELEPTRKRLIMAVLLAVVAAIALGMSCVGWISAEASAACTQGGALQLVTTYIAALVANQATYAISPRVERAVAR